MENKNSILIVDDQKSNLLYLNQILSGEYTIYTAKDAEEGIKRANEYLPDLILLDIIMPGMDGYEALAVLRESEKTREIPVIFISALDSSDDERKGLKLGAADYIIKPFSDAIVKLRVQNQIKIKNQMRLIVEKETAEQTSRAKSEFLSRMSHEMRTPMNAIISMTAMAQNSDDPEKIRDCLEKTSRASHDLLRLIDDVLGLSDMEEGKFSLVPGLFSIETMLKNIYDRTSCFFTEKNQVFTKEIDPSIPEFLVADEKRLSQVIINLLSNASKFSGERGLIQLKIFVNNIENDELTVQVEVIDNGIGISKDQENDLFVAFEQLDGGMTRKYSGAGLGLPISKKIVELMGGRLWVESEPGKGSRFAFTFKARIKTPDVQKYPPVSFDGKTALLAEDVEINREIVTSMLEDTRLNIVYAANGSEAVSLYSSNPEKFDLVFMDVNMPEMDGVEATRKIRAMEAEGKKRIPIIAMTANVHPDEVKSYLAAGMTDHIGKPIDFDRLLHMVNSYTNLPVMEMSV